MQTFNEYLREYFQQTELRIPKQSFENWLCRIDAGELVKLAEQWKEQECEKIVKQFVAYMEKIEEDIHDDHGPGDLKDWVEPFMEERSRSYIFLDSLAKGKNNGHLRE